MVVSSSLSSPNILDDTESPKTSLPPLHTQVMAMFDFGINGNERKERQA
jgi:hypothetical protein